MSDEGTRSVSPARKGAGAVTGLIGRDRAFLREYLQFGYIHHVVAAEALRSAYERADETATIVREQVERTDRATAPATASRLNDGARVQTVAVARLLSEYAAAIEDLGALLHGIRHRARGGVMVEYLEATVSGSADVLDLVIERGGQKLPRLLDLPDLRSLGDTVDPSTLEALKHDYDALGDHLIQIGGQYRDKGPQGIASASRLLQRFGLLAIELLAVCARLRPRHDGGAIPCNAVPVSGRSCGWRRPAVPFSPAPSIRGGARD